MTIFIISNERYLHSLNKSSTIKIPYSNSRKNILDISRESAFTPLVIPSFHPCIGTNRLIHLFKVFTWLVIGATYLLATMEIQIALVAVSRLIRIGKAWIKWSSFKWKLYVFSQCRCHIYLEKLILSTFTRIQMEHACFIIQKQYCSY